MPAPLSAQGGGLVLGSWGLGGDEFSGVGVDVVEVGMVGVVVLGVVRQDLLDAAGDAPHRLHVRLRRRPAPRPPAFDLPPPPVGSHAPSCLSLGARGALALALRPPSGPHASVPLPLTPGAAASSGGMRGRRLFGLPPSALGPEGEGGESRGGPLVPWRRPLTAEGGQPGGPGPGGKPSPGGSHSSPAPLYLEPDPGAGPRWGPLSPPPSPRGVGRPGAAVMVSGQRLADCGAVGSPRAHCLCPELAHPPPSRRIVGVAWVGGPSSPPHFLASAVWAVTCAAACLAAGAVAVAGCAGGGAIG